MDSNYQSKTSVALQSSHYSVNYGWLRAVVCGAWGQRGKYWHVACRHWLLLQAEKASEIAVRQDIA